MASRTRVASGEMSDGPLSVDGVDHGEDGSRASDGVSDGQSHGLRPAAAADLSNVCSLGGLAAYVRAALLCLP